MHCRRLLGDRATLDVPDEPFHPLFLVRVLHRAGVVIGADPGDGLPCGNPSEDGHAREGGAGPTQAADAADLDPLPPPGAEEGLPDPLGRKFEVSRQTDGGASTPTEGAHPRGIQGLGKPAGAKGRSWRGVDQWPKTCVGGTVKARKLWVPVLSIRL